MSVPLEKIGEIAERTARKANAIPMAHFRAPLDFDAKADDNPVTVVERKTEASIRDALQAPFPNIISLAKNTGSPGLWTEKPGSSIRLTVSGLSSPGHPCLAC